MVKFILQEFTNNYNHFVLQFHLLPWFKNVPNVEKKQHFRCGRTSTRTGHQHTQDPGHCSTLLDVPVKSPCVSADPGTDVLQDTDKRTSSEEASKRQVHPSKLTPTYPKTVASPGEHHPSNPFFRNLSRFTWAKIASTTAKSQSRSAHLCCVCNGNLLRVQCRLNPPE